MTRLTVAQRQIAYDAVMSEYNETAQDELIGLLREGSPLSQEEAIRIRIAVHIAAARAISPVRKAALLRLEKVLPPL